jgi:hypothetical protein
MEAVRSGLFLTVLTLPQIHAAEEYVFIELMGSSFAVERLSGIGVSSYGIG